LLEVLKDLEGLLVQAGERHWTEAVRYHIRYVEHCPPRDITAAARNILAMYGGMGSFNDMPLSGKLEKLHTELWELATATVRESRER
jgi:hypothetical protein